MKKVSLLVLFSFMTPLIAEDLSFKLQKVNREIAQLEAENNAGLKELQQCEKKVKGFKIAGITTLGVTAVGVGGNIALATKKKKLDSESDSLDSKIISQQEELKNKKQDLADLKEENRIEKERLRKEAESAALAQAPTGTIVLTSVEQSNEESGVVANTENSGQSEPVEKTEKSGEPVTEKSEDKVSEKSNEITKKEENEIDKGKARMQAALDRKPDEWVVNADGSVTKNGQPTNYNKQNYLQHIVVGDFITENGERNVVAKTNKVSDGNTVNTTIYKSSVEANTEKAVVPESSSKKPSGTESNPEVKTPEKPDEKKSISSKCNNCSQIENLITSDNFDNCSVNLLNTCNIYDDMNAIQYASYFDYNHLLPKLIKMGVDVNARTLDGLQRTALMLAVLNDKPDAVSILLSAGASKNYVDYEKKRVCDHLVKRFEDNPYEDQKEGLKRMNSKLNCDLSLDDKTTDVEQKNNLVSFHNVVLDKSGDDNGQSKVEYRQANVSYDKHPATAKNKYEIEASEISIDQATAMKMANSTLERECLNKGDSAANIYIEIIEQKMYVVDENNQSKYKYVMKANCWK